MRCALTAPSDVQALAKLEGRLEDVIAGPEPVQVGTVEGGLFAWQEVFVIAQAGPGRLC